MLIALLIVASLGIFLNAGLAWVNHKDNNAKFTSISEGFSDFFAAGPENSPSNFNQVVDQIAVLFADRYRIALTAVDRGQQGAAVRDVNRGLEEIAAQNDPAYAVAQILPRSLKKNQVAQAGLMYLIQNMMSKSGSKNGGAQGRGAGQSEFNF